MSGLFKFARVAATNGCRRFCVFPCLLPRTILGNHKFECLSNATFLLLNDVFQQHRSFYICGTRCVGSQFSPKTVSDLEHKFDMTFPKIVEDITPIIPADGSVEDVIAWFKHVMHYNVTGGKRYRGMTVVNMCNSLGSGNFDDLLQQKSCVLGWCVEMLQAFLLINDDIMDQSETRRGKLCWYKKEEVNLSAINDALFLETAIYKILQHYFSETAYYDQIVAEFREATWKTVIGQCMDLKSFSCGKPNWNYFTPERYAAIVKYKTSSYTFCLPVNLAFILISTGDHESKIYNMGNHANERHRMLQEELMIKIGHYFQVQDDYLDCFGDPLTAGKHGTDIKDGKCTWLILEALRIAEPETKKILKEIYGKKGDKEVNIVKEIYENLNIPEQYAKYEDRTYREICSMINNIYPVDDVCRSLFSNIIKMLHCRRK